MPISVGDHKKMFEMQLQKLVDNKVDALVTRLHYLGLKCVREARTARIYTDQTGNLRSSTGYAVVKYGKVMFQSGFKAESVSVKTGDGKEKRSTGTEGAREGKEFLEELCSKAPKDSIVLILVAGMNYAQYVEDLGFNVLDSATRLAKTSVDDIMKGLGFKRAV